MDNSIFKLKTELTQYLNKNRDNLEGEDLILIEKTIDKLSDLSSSSDPANLSNDQMLSLLEMIFRMLDLACAFNQLTS